MSTAIWFVIITNMNKLYKQFAKYYDLIYTKKDYKSEFDYQNKLIKKYQKSKGKDLLEVACGTGRYLEYCEKTYHCTGFDLNQAMLNIAKKKLKKTKLHQGNMQTFDLHKQFDIVTCLFSSIGYLKNTKQLEQTIVNFSKHLKPGGVFLISPWLSKQAFKVCSIHMNGYYDDNIKITRAVVSKFKKPNISVMDFHWMIAERNKDVKYISGDKHELTMFTEKEFKTAFTKAGLKVDFIKQNKDSRGLYVAVKAL